MKKLLIILLAISFALFFVMCTPIAPPVFDPAGGDVEAGSTVTITCPTADVSIYYTTSTTDTAPADPTTADTPYSAPITINANTIIKAIAAKGDALSEVTTATYTIKVATPTFNPAAGAVASGTAVTIACATTGASIRYTLNGNDPTEADTLYSATNKPVITPSALTLKAKAFKAGMTSSDVATATYTLSSVTLTVNITGNGTVAVSANGTPQTGTGPYTVTSGSTISLTATPGGTEQFLGWTGAVSGTDNPASFVINANSTVDAFFGDPNAPVTLYVYAPANVWGDASGWEILFDNDDNIVTDALDYNPNTSNWITDVIAIYGNTEFVMPAFPVSASGYPLIVSKTDIVPGTYDWFITNPTIPTGWNGTAFTNTPTNQYGANPTYLAGATSTGSGFTANNNNFYFVPGATYTITITGNSTDGETIVLESGNQLPPAALAVACGATAIQSSATVQDIGAGGSSLTFTLKNSGGAPLNITGITFTNTADVTLSTNPAPVTLDVAETANLVFTVNNTVTDSGTVTITHNATGSPFVFNFSYVVMVPVTLPEGFEGADWANLTSGNTWSLGGETLPTLDTTQFQEGAQSVKFLQPTGSTVSGYLSALVPVTAGDVISLYYKRLTGSGSYSFMKVYDGATQIGTSVIGPYSTPDTTWQKWVSPVFTESGDKLIKILFIQESGSGYPFEMYIDNLTCAPPTPNMTVKYGTNNITDGSIYSLPGNVAVGQEISFTVGCPSTSLVGLNISGFNYGTGPTEITNSTPLPTGTIAINGSATTSFTVTTMGSYTSGIITISNNSDIPNFTFRFSATAVNPPSAPTGVGAVHSGSGVINVTWTEPASLPGLGYNVYRATTAGGPYTLANSTPVAPGTATYADSVGDGTYYYVVRSLNAGPVESVDSNEAGPVSVTGVGTVVGTGNNITHKTPMYPYYEFSYSQSIYLQSEINKAGTIDRIYFYYGPSATNLTNRIFTIYMGHTTKAAFTSNTDWITTDLTEVFTTSAYNLVPGQWNEIILTTPFVYNNTDNLFVASDYNQDNYTGTASTDNFFGTAGTGRSITFYSDTVNATPATPPTSGTNLYLRDFFPNIKIHFQ